MWWRCVSNVKGQTGPNQLVASPLPLGFSTRETDTFPDSCRWLEGRMEAHAPATERSTVRKSIARTRHYSEGNFIWATMFGQNVRLQPASLQGLSELERARLQEVAFYRLQGKNLNCDISIPRGGPKRRKSLRRKLDSFSKEKKESPPKAFGIALSQVIANDRAHKQKQEAVKESRRDCLEVEATVIRFLAQKQKKSPADRNSLMGSSLEFSDEPLSPTFLDNMARARRRGALSVDSITDLDDNHSRLLEALQLSHPHELESRWVMERNKKLSLNPIYRQVPRIVERCCQHIETYGLQTVGIFRVGSSKKRVRQLRDEYDLGLDVHLDESQSVHDVAALLKEFLRDMPDPLLPRELYAAFIATAALCPEDQLAVLQLLIYLLPPCNGDTLLRILEFLDKVAQHAQDSCGHDGEEVPGNKMTIGNLATIFGPNLLQREKVAEKDYNMHSLGIEDSAAIITVIQRLIENYKTLFMVSPELQNEVLMRLLQTDPDIIDYLLRRKFKSPLNSESSEASGEQDGSQVSIDSEQLADGKEEYAHFSIIDLCARNKSNQKELTSDIFQPGSKPLDYLRHFIAGHGIGSPLPQSNAGLSDLPVRPLSQRRASRSHEDLSLKDYSPPMHQEKNEKPLWGRSAERPKFLPLFSKVHGGSQQSPESPQIDWDKLLATSPQGHDRSPTSTGIRRLIPDLCRTRGSRSPSSASLDGANCSPLIGPTNHGSPLPRDPESQVWVRQDSTNTPQTEEPSPDCRPWENCERSNAESQRETVV
ncbi:rho GTPase-activating protein 6-like isoform X2 [Ambystoma mexicanum]|uniref:rho GTPase-activating protein 6-like isoform X2 n=1 Tax=Ambystoma mexicanum TaxID=8296 RepID=UPI0037E7F237